MPKEMAMSFWRLYYHLVWSTQEREPLIQPEVEKRLYAYIVAKASELEVYIYAINGWNDHVHLLASIPPKHAIADVVKHLKGASSHDLNHAGGLEGRFGWQRGYGVFSLGESQRPIAEAYVNNQKRHHADQTTNPWLERCDELDEGPSDTGLRAGAVPQIVRETPAVYPVLGEPPF